MPRSIIWLLRCRILLSRRSARLRCMRVLRTRMWHHSCVMLANVYWCHLVEVSTWKLNVLALTWTHRSSRRLRRGHAIWVTVARVRVRWTIMGAVRHQWLRTILRIAVHGRSSCRVGVGRAGGHVRARVHVHVWLTLIHGEFGFCRHCYLVCAESQGVGRQ